jgi:hypothetical protein
MTGSFQSAFEREAEAVRQHLEATPLAKDTQLGSWFEGWKDSGTGGLVQTIVKTDIRINVEVESWLARATYWLAVVVGLAISGFPIWLFVHDGMRVMTCWLRRLFSPPRCCCTARVGDGDGFGPAVPTTSF